MTTRGFGREVGHTRSRIETGVSQKKRVNLLPLLINLIEWEEQDRGNFITIIDSISHQRFVKCILLGASSRYTVYPRLVNSVNGFQCVGHS